jgi:DNA-binding NarL/FixJ family response regulator
MIRLLVVDDHIPARQKAVAELTTDGVIQVIAEADTSDEAYKIAQQLLPEIVLLDLHLPGLITTPVLIQKLVALKNVRVIIYASQGKAAEVQDLLDIGASAYVSKNDQSALTKMAILMVSRGSRNIISPSLPRNLLSITAPERNILKEITRRGGLPKAAERMGVTEFDLNSILEIIANKLELKDSDSLSKWAKRHGF